MILKQVLLHSNKCGADLTQHRFLLGEKYENTIWNKTITKTEQKEVIGA